MKKVYIPAIVFLALLLLPVILSVKKNDGHFVYTLDDPYIHLALSENIAAGHYGINRSEYTAPSSSALWPFLLVPFSFISSSFSSLVPLLMNTVFALVTLFLLHRFYGKKGLLLTIASIFAFNLVGLVFTGMEHSLQVLLVVVIAVGTSAFLEKRKVYWWTSAALVVAPLIRYECLAVSLPVLLFLFFAGERKKALLLFLITVLLLAAFSLFLIQLGLDPLPASVYAKSSLVSDSGSMSSVLGNLGNSLKSFRGMTQLLLLVLIAAVLFSKKRNRREKLFACTAILSVVLHLVAGRSGWFHRYGVYMWVFSVLAASQLYRNLLYRYRIPAAILILVLSADYLSGYTKIPDASHNIYQQQYQMRRFVHEWLQEPVAVNDLGMVSMGYDEYVLDLWGLATPGAILGAADPAWIDSIAFSNGVNSAIVYRDELPGIQHWTYVARMEISQPLVVCVSGGVDFLAAPWVAEDSLRARLDDFSESLPEGIEMVVYR